MDAARELEGLWAELFGEPPSIKAQPDVLIEVLVAMLPPVQPYGAAAPAEDDTTR
jgi:hypothetical protein